MEEGEELHKQSASVPILFTLYYFKYYIYGTDKYEINMFKPTWKNLFMACKPWYDKTNKKRVLSLQISMLPLIRAFAVCIMKLKFPPIGQTVKTQMRRSLIEALVFVMSRLRCTIKLQTSLCIHTT